MFVAVVCPLWRLLEQLLRTLRAQLSLILFEGLLWELEAQHSHAQCLLSGSTDTFLASEDHAVLLEAEACCVPCRD